MKIKSTKGKLILTALLFSAFLIPTTPSQPISYQKTLLTSDTIRIQTSVGHPILDIQLIENTNQCLGKCYAILRIHPYQAFTFPQQPTALENLQFLKPDPTHRGLKSHSFELLQETHYNITIPIYQTINTTCFNSNTSSYEPCVITNQTGVQTETKIKQYWLPLTLWGHTFLPNKDYTIKILGEKYASVGENNIDWLLTLKGLPLSEWAWWNSSWQFRRQINITNNNLTAPLLNDYTINLSLDHSALVSQGKSLENGADLRIIFNDTELDRLNISEFNLSNATLIFKLQNNISAGSTDSDYFLYYGNPQAGAPPANGSFIFLDFCNFENLCGWTTITSCWSAANGTLTCSGSAPTRPVAYSPLSLSGDIIYEIEAKSISGTFQIGAISRVHDDNNFYDNLIELTDRTTIYKRIGGVWTKLNEVGGSFSGASYYKLKTTIKGNTINTTVNDQHFLNATDDAITFGFQGADGYGLESTAFRNFRVRRFFLPEPTITLTPENPGNGTLSIVNIIPVQVIQNVDLVKGKRTLVRTILNYDPQANQSQAFTSITIYLNGINVTPLTAFALQNGTMPYDIFFTNPTIEGQNLQLISEVSSTVPGFTMTNVTKLVNVTRTRQFNVTFVKVDITSLIPQLSGAPTTFLNSSLENLKFINKTYPLADNGISTNIPNTVVRLQFSHTILTADGLLAELEEAGQLPGNFPERTVGIIKTGFGIQIPFCGGISCAIGFLPSLPFHLRAPYKSVIVEEFLTQTAAHELAHTYGQCDEYNSSSQWEKQKQFFGSCPNGDSSPEDGNFDLACKFNEVLISGQLINISACPTFSLQPLTGHLDSTELINYMGEDDKDLRPANRYWTTSDSFTHLLTEFSHSSPVFAERRILLRGRYNKSSNIGVLENFYELGSGFAENITQDDIGNFSIKLFSPNGTLILNIPFDLTFNILSDSGNTSDINESSFVFVIPYPESTSLFEFKKNYSLIDNRSVSSNEPQITLLSPLGGESFSNQQINISWIASDADNDTLGFSILASNNNGSTFSTLVLNHNTSSFLVNSSAFADGDYIIRILATDGVNTANTTSNSTFRINNDLKITGFRIVYQNQTQRIFEIKMNNTLSSNITNISWTFNTGETLKESTLTFNLKPFEQILLFLYHNYSSPGNYIASFTAVSNDLRESENKTVGVI